MPATMPVNATLQGWITDTVGGVSLTNVPADDIIVAISGDVSDYTITMDSPPVPNPGGPSVASFKVTSSATPTQPNIPVNLAITASGDATLAPGSEADSITVSEQATQVLGTLFGTPVALASAVKASAAEKPTAKKVG